MTTQPGDDWRKDGQYVLYLIEKTGLTREQVLVSTMAGWSTWSDWSAGKASAQLLTLKVWGDEKPKVGQYFIAYGRYDEDPSLCKMTSTGPQHSSFNWTIVYMAYGEGGTLESDLVFADETRWHHLATRTPNWTAIVGKMIDDGVKL